MRFIEGGSFEMGDFGHKLDWTDGLPLTGQSDNKPLHPVTLDSFSMNAYKATYGDFDVYSMATGQDEEGMQPIGIEIRQPKHNGNMLRVISDKMSCSQRIRER